MENRLVELYAALCSLVSWDRELSAQSNELRSLHNSSMRICIDSDLHNVVSFLKPWRLELLGENECRDLTGKILVDGN